MQFFFHSLSDLTESETIQIALLSDESVLSSRFSNSLGTNSRHVPRALVGQNKLLAARHPGLSRINRTTDLDTLWIP
jgi:hypothetical protein